VQSSSVHCRRVLPCSLLRHGSTAGVDDPGWVEEVVRVVAFVVRVGMRISRQELQEIRELPDAREVDHLRELDLSNKVGPSNLFGSPNLFVWAARGLARSYVWMACDLSVPVWDLLGTVCL
jgi:hypothetical protein